MKRNIFSILMLFFLSINSQNIQPFKSGEWLKYKISYSGWLKAGEATVSLTNDKINGIDLFHSKMVGKTTGALNLLFKVRDRYESFFENENILTNKFIRNINEGGYKKNIEIRFNHDKDEATVNNLKTKSLKNFKIKKNAQDMVSVFYFLRKYFSINDLDDKNEISVNMFFDSENYNLKIKYLKTEIINTNFGKILCFKIRPYVQYGRVFKKDESLTMWITADDNRIPIKVKADLIVGSIRIDLESFSNLTNSFKIQF